MDHSKCAALKAALADLPEPPIIPIERYFDGNDDPASIGCNLPNHPGVGEFARIITGLLTRPDVHSVYAMIAELDPGEDYWPFTDTILVMGAISPEELLTVVRSLQPSEVLRSTETGISPDLIQKYAHGQPILAIWWD